MKRFIIDEVQKAPALLLLDSIHSLIEEKKGVKSLNLTKLRYAPGSS
jgi:hypothetical protein